LLTPRSALKGCSREKEDIGFVYTNPRLFTQIRIWSYCFRHVSYFVTFNYWRIDLWKPNHQNPFLLRNLSWCNVWTTSESGRETVKGNCEHCQVLCSIPCLQGNVRWSKKRSVRWYQQKMKKHNNILSVVFKN